MKFNLKEKKVTKSKQIILGVKGPNIGDKKVKVKFALFPHKLFKKNIIVWLEKYIQTFEYKEIYEFQKFRTYNLSKSYWYDDLYKTNSWVLIDESLIK